MKQTDFFLPLRNQLRPAFVGLFLFGLAMLGAAPALAQQGAIHLTAESSTYKPGKSVTLFAYFYRAPRAGFFRSWQSSLRSNRDFRVVEIRQISGIREVATTPQGYQRSLFHIVYRVRMVPRTTTGTLTYGPVQFQGLVSNTLSFQPQAGTSSAVANIKVQVKFDRKQYRRGVPFNINLEINCPRSLCPYNRVNYRALEVHFRRAIKISSPASLTVTRKTATPRVTYPAGTPLKTQIFFQFQGTPLKSGSMLTPRFEIRLPILTVIDQLKVIKRLKQWVIKTHKLGKNRVDSFFGLRQQTMAFLAFETLFSSQQSIQVENSSATPGQWTLISSVVQKAGTNQLLWKVGLSGKGFMPLALQALKDTLTKHWKTHNLADKLQLQHAMWRLPDGSLGGRSEILYYFGFKNKRVALPGFSMTFSDGTGKTYVKKAAAVGVKESPGTMNENFDLQAVEHNLYIHAARPLNRGPQPVQVWGYRLPDSFPVQAFLQSRYDLKSGVSLTPQQKMKTITQRRVMGPGMSFQSSRTFPINVSVGQVTAGLNKGIFTQLPVVYWGARRYAARVLSKSEMYLTSQMSRKKYFVGESVEYQLRIHCPASVCTPKHTKRLAKLFKASVKLPNIDRFRDVQEIEKYQRKVLRPGWVTFTYRVRFRPAGEGKVSLKAAVLRLERNKLIMLAQRHQLCLFNVADDDNVILDAIVRDHMRANSSQCVTGTRELRAEPVSTDVVGLPSNAANVKLIGTFRLNSKLARLTYPRKQATSIDKPFYLVIELSGDGDLKTGGSLLQDQVSAMLRKLRKESVTGYMEVSNDPDLKRKGIVRIQVQLIAEQLGKLKIPSLKLKYYHREEGLLTAQTLPVTVKIEPRTGTRVVVARTTPKTKQKITRKQRQLATATDLRPNQVLGNQSLENEYFELKSMEPLVWIFTSPMLFLFFLGWNRREMQRKADPAREQQQKALKQFKKAISDLSGGSDSSEWAQGVLQATQRFLADRLRLNSKNMTLSEIDDVLNERDKDGKLKDERKKLADLLEELEATIYGGGEISDQRAFLNNLESLLQTLQRQLPQA